MVERGVCFANTPGARFQITPLVQSTLPTLSALLGSALALFVELADPLGDRRFPGFGLAGNVGDETSWLKAETPGHAHLIRRQSAALRRFRPFALLLVRRSSASMALP